MFKPLPADPALIQKLRIRNRVASLTSFGLLVAFPSLSSFITMTANSEASFEYFAMIQLVGLVCSSLLIPASVFFFTHALRYKKLLAHLGTNPTVFAATEPAPSDLKKLRSKKTSAIVWHSITLGAPLIWAAAAATTDFSDKGAALGFVFLGTFLVMSALAGGLVMSATSINSYLTFKAQLRWAFPDASSFRVSPKNV
ncbi:MAG: hypothetical protein ACOVP3_02940 [Rhodoluna sp.]|jgi:hypothetical protein